MPTVVNGIGTWYYGKRRIQTRKSVCESCNSLGILQSYDTTEFFVVVFVPIIPLGAKRIIDECPSCQKHRVSKLADWEKAKSQSFAELTEELQQHPGDRDVLIKALAMPVAYQDEKLFEQVVDTLPDSSQKDAEIQAQVGHGFVYFGRYQDAEKAFRASLAVRGDPEVREALAMVLMRLGRPDDAEPMVRHVFEERLTEKSWIPYFLAEAYQAAGRHEEALAVMDRRDQVFPDQIEDKDCKKQRKLSERHRSSGKPIPSAFLSSSSGTGYSDGNATALLPKLIFPILIVVGLAVYLYSTISIGNARKVHLVNGLGKEYKIKLNGEERKLPPGRTEVRIPEGETTVEIVDASIPLEPSRFTIETSFWSRPFKNHTIVINPDRQALVFEETTIYSKTPKQGPDPVVKFGDVMYEFNGIDYEFGEFPQTVSTKSSEVTKKRVGTAPLSEMSHYLQIAGIKDNQQRLAAIKTWIGLEPNNSLALQALSMAGDKEAIEILKTGLEARPLRVDWHRYYQSQMERLDPKHDLVAEYRKVAESAKNDPDAIYLLARCLDGEESDEMMKKAAESNPPSRFAMQSLGYRDCAMAKFTEAAGWYEKAIAMAKDDFPLKQLYHEALLGAGRYDDLIKAMNTDGTSAAQQTIERLRVCAAKNDDKQAQIEIDNAVKARAGTPAEQQETRKSWQGYWAICRGDLAGYLATQTGSKDPPSAELLLLQGKLKEASESSGENAASIQGLTYLSALKDKNQAAADNALDAMVKALGTQDRHDRFLGEVLAGKKPFQYEEILRLPIHPREKRVYMAVMAKKFPDHAEELNKLSKALDCQRDITSMCLAKAR